MSPTNTTFEVFTNIDWYSFPLLSLLSIIKDISILKITEKDYGDLWENLIEVLTIFNISIKSKYSSMHLERYLFCSFFTAFSRCKYRNTRCKHVLACAFGFTLICLLHTFNWNSSLFLCKENNLEISINHVNRRIIHHFGIYHHFKCT